MANLQQYPAKICLTTCAVLIHEQSVLLVKHKKVGLWLNPGGHIEANELPHQAAERECWEETNIKVKAVDWQKLPATGTEYVPNPFATNLHWASQENYNARTADPEQYQPLSPWKRGCEQHLNFLYLVEAIDSVEFKQNVEETDGIKWVELDKLDEADLHSDIKTDIQEAWKVYQTHEK